MNMMRTFYSNQSTADSCNLGTLAVIYPLLERMKVAQIINQHLPTDPQAEYGHGMVLSLLVAARLYSPVALVNVAQWAAESGADVLWDIPVEKINDDRLGRSLDALFTQRHSILASLALHVADEFDVPLAELHYDPTHILFYGAYEHAQAPGEVQNEEGILSDEHLEPAHITKGRPTLNAPKTARMIHVGLCTYVDQLGPLPVFGHTVDGNKNGHSAVAEQLALMRKHLRPAELTLFSDRGTYSVGHLARLYAEGYSAVCSAPWEEFRSLFDQHHRDLRFNTASYLSIEQTRRRDRNSELSREHYELAALDHQLTDPESGEVIPARVIFVFSTADQKVVRKNRQKQIEQLQQGLEKTQKSVWEGRRNTDVHSIARRVDKLFGKKQAARYFQWEMVALSQQEREGLPSPRRGCRRPTHRFEFCFDSQAVSHDQDYDGYSVLVTTMPEEQASEDVVFTKFKQQTYSEQVNGQFKGPLAVHPVFLHSPRRVEALVFVMMITLMLYYLLQRIYRQNVPEGASPKERRTTTRTILQSFAAYTLLIHHTEHGRHVQPTRLTLRQRQILRHLCFPTPAQILSRRLPRSPT